jgi:hypothetical protein
MDSLRSDLVSCGSIFHGETGARESFFGTSGMAGQFSGAPLVLKVRHMAVTVVLANRRREIEFAAKSP